MKTYSKARTELRNLQFLKKMLEKSSQFLSSDQPSEPKSLDVALIMLGKLAIAVNLKAIRFEFWTGRGVSGRWFSNQFQIVSETSFSCDTVGSELLWAVLCSLLCRETNHVEHSHLKARLCVYLINLILRVMFWCFTFVTSISVSKNFCDWEELNLLNESIS